MALSKHSSPYGGKRRRDLKVRCPKKRARFGNFPSFLRGAGVHSPSAFPWPYSPAPTVNSVADFFKRWLDYISMLLMTRYDDNRGDKLREVDVQRINKAIETALAKYLDAANGVLNSYEHPLYVLMHVLEMINMVLVTNKTANTAIVLETQRGQTVFNLHETRLMKAGQMTTTHPIIVHDWRFSGSAQQPSTHRVFLDKQNFVATSQGNKLHVQIVLDPNDRGRDVLIEVEWLGPRDGIVNDQRDEKVYWTKVEDLAGRNVIIEEERPRRTENHAAELLKWLPHIRKLAETKVLGVHKNFKPDDLNKMITSITATLNQWQGWAESGNLPENFDQLFKMFVCTLRVENLTDGSIVYVQQGENVLWFASNDHLIVPMRSFDPVSSAEVHFPETGEVIPITEDMLTADVVEDHLEMKLNVRQGRTVRLRVAWLGPGVMTPDSYLWASFLRKPVVESEEESEGEDLDSDADSGFRTMMFEPPKAEANPPEAAARAAFLTVPGVKRTSLQVPGKTPVPVSMAEFEMENLDIQDPLDDIPKSVPKTPRVKRTPRRILGLELGKSGAVASPDSPPRQARTLRFGAEKSSDDIPKSVPKTPVVKRTRRSLFGEDLGESGTQGQPDSPPQQTGIPSSYMEEPSDEIPKSVPKTPRVKRTPRRVFSEDLRESGAQRQPDPPSQQTGIPSVYVEEPSDDIPESVPKTPRATRAPRKLFGEKVEESGELRPPSSPPRQARKLRFDPEEPKVKPLKSILKTPKPSRVPRKLFGDQAEEPGALGPPDSPPRRTRRIRFNLEEAEEESEEEPLRSPRKLFGEDYEESGAFGSQGSPPSRARIPVINLEEPSDDSLKSVPRTPRAKRSPRKPFDEKVEESGALAPPGSPPRQARTSQLGLEKPSGEPSKFVPRHRRAQVTFGDPSTVAFHLGFSPKSPDEVRSSNVSSRTGARPRTPRTLFGDKHSTPTGSESIEMETLVSPVPVRPEQGLHFNTGEYSGDVFSPPSDSGISTPSTSERVQLRKQALSKAQSAWEEQDFQPLTSPSGTDSPEASAPPKLSIFSPRRFVSPGDFPGDFSEDLKRLRKRSRLADRFDAAAEEEEQQK